MKPCEAIEHLAEYQDQLWRELQVRREIMRWVADRLAIFERLYKSKYHKATCRELRNALLDSPKLKEFQK